MRTSQHYWAAEEAMTVYPALVSGAVGELRFHCRWKKEGTACDKKLNLWCSLVQSGGGLDSASHRVLIRRTFQRTPVASQGLLQLSSRKGINIPPGLSGNCQNPRVDFRRAHLKRATAGFEESFYPLDRRLIYQTCTRLHVSFNIICVKLKIMWKLFHNNSQLYNCKQQPSVRQGGFS